MTTMEIRCALLMLSLTIAPATRNPPAINDSDQHFSYDVIPYTQLPLRPGAKEINPQTTRQHIRGLTLMRSFLSDRRNSITSFKKNCTYRKVHHDIVVNCSHQNLIHIPMDITKSATVLNLSHNNISVIPRRTFCRLVLLRYLDLSNNRLSQLTSGTFVGLYRLSTLLLNDNPLNMSSVTFPPDVFAPLSNLTHLNVKTSSSIKDPSSQYPDVSLSPLRSLKTLLISGLSNRTFGEGVRKLVSLKTLDLSGTSSFVSLPKNVFVNFKNISLKVLNLSYCNLKWIHKEAFCNLPNIDTIDYSYNKCLEIKGVGISSYGLKNSTIRKVLMRRIHASPSFTAIRKEDVQHMTHTKLEELHMEYNTIGQLESGTMEALPKTLKVVNASWNSIHTYFEQVGQLLRLPNMEIFDASHQGLDEEPEKQFSTVEELSGPGWRNLISPSNDIIVSNTYGETSPLSYKIRIPPRLQVVNCSSTYMLRFSLPPIEFINSSLKGLYFSENLLKQWIGPLKGTESLEDLDLTNNHCDKVSETFFAYMTNLQTLRIGKNSVGKDLTERTFYNLTSLAYLDMNDIQLEYLRPNLFSRLTNLTHLNLSHNYLASWNAYISGLVKLQTLDLKNNTFRSLPASLCQDLDAIQRHSHLQIDIQGNPLVCECNTEYFVRWLTTTQVTIRNLDAVTCKLENGTSLPLSAKEAILAHLQQHCRSYTVVISAVCACLGLFLIVSLVVVIHRHRWKLRYLCHVASNWRKRTGYQSLDSAEENPFGFDAFVSYEDSDRTFIREQIIQRLEIEAGLKLCIDKRDFVAGLYVTDNILHAIQNSRKTVVLLSRQFLKSKWCMYEFNMARMEGIHTGRQVLVVVLTEEIPTGQLSAEVIDVIHNQTYIEMTNNRYGEALFWDRLLSAIKSP